MMFTLVSGSSRGLGLKITEDLLRNDEKVIGLSRNITPELEKLKSIYGAGYLHLNANLASPVEVESVIKSITLDGVVCIKGYVNNAAIAYDDLITNLNTKELLTMYNVNVFSPMIITKYILRNMLLHRTEGSIVHISSISVHTGYKGLSFYASTKGALEAFSKNTAREWGSRGIRSNCIVSGFMETDMSSSLSSEQKNKIYNRTCLKKPTSINSVAAVTRFLLSEGSASLTAQNIFVDSGTI